MIIFTKKDIWHCGYLITVSPGCAQWDTLNFDAACANPNYYGNTEVDTNWIKNTTVFSQYYHTGIQISFWEWGCYLINTHLYDYLNLVLVKDI